MTFLNPEGTVNSAPAVNVEPFSLDDNTDVTIVGFKGSTNRPRGFIPDIDGVVSVLNINDTVANITVVKGNVYPIVVKRFRTTGTTGGMTGVMLA